MHSREVDMNYSIKDQEVLWVVLLLICFHIVEEYKANMLLHQFDMRYVSKPCDTNVRSQNINLKNPYES